MTQRCEKREISSPFALGFGGTQCECRERFGAGWWPFASFAWHFVISHQSKTIRIVEDGFGLLEVVISAGILASVIGASVGLLSTSLRRATLASSRATAMNLAQETIELVRAARDTTYRDGLSNQWNAPFVQLSTAEGTLAKPGDSFALVYAQGSDGSCCYFKATQTDSAGLPEGSTISHGVETLTVDGQPYQRELYVSLPGINYGAVAGLPAGVAEADAIRKITVIVRWGSSVTEAVSSIEYLTDWRT